MKRLIDVVVSLLGLVVTSPLCAFISIWIKTDSAGPVIFRQERVGRRGKPFAIHKFRTMHIDVSGAAVTVGSDPRITRSGRFLRRTKLDELPQLFDVLIGTMSLVGPRPEVPQYVADWPAEVRDIVLSVRPGVTDPAALVFRDESELLARQPDPERYYREVVVPQKLDLYVDYIRRATARTDLELVWATVKTVIVPTSTAQVGRS